MTEREAEGEWGRWAEGRGLGAQGQNTHRLWLGLKVWEVMGAGGG